jgi:hypothetical protein
MFSITLVKISLAPLTNSFWEHNLTFDKSFRIKIDLLAMYDLMKLNYLASKGDAYKRLVVEPIQFMQS